MVMPTKSSVMVVAVFRLMPSTSSLLTFGDDDPCGDTAVMGFGHQSCDSRDREHNTYYPLLDTVVRSVVRIVQYSMKTAKSGFVAFL